MGARAAQVRDPANRFGGALATHEDAATIAHIYNPGIEDRIATFQTGPRTVADVERLFAEREGHYPTIVVERDGEVVAWASASECEDHELTDEGTSQYSSKEEIVTSIRSA